MLLMALSPGRCPRAGEPPLLCGCVCCPSGGGQAGACFPALEKGIIYELPSQQPLHPPILLPAHCCFLCFLPLKGSKPCWILLIFHPSQDCVPVSPCTVRLWIPSLPAKHLQGSSAPAPAEHPPCSWGTVLAKGSSGFGDHTQLFDGFSHILPTGLFYKALGLVPTSS